jgi:uncharacterized hydantoinase/oxoprolinase family protein
LCSLLGGRFAAELFATTLDAYLLLGHQRDDPDDTATADGRPATRAAAEARLARMLCADLETSTEDERRFVAETAANRQLDLIGQALVQVAGRLPGPPRTVVVSGSGEFLATLALNLRTGFADCATVRLSDLLGPEVSGAACAYALAVLAREGRHG